ncbi:carboxypeptidase regulatory-like domain-containing protein [Streptomyces sp. NPDC059837]|uniref:SLAC1 family transporter n=1 Tax=unclassified Streptomyces TaxID=2593676 RepID=UPI0022543829|nr:carboxypeptidase regulatory-like domain-containing protein [Streptomyces sp. NBC_01764]MCX4403606.1 carboxypeptidase regulatory-like domain-containing protein [Streptomyces sp. NBC_01764]
MNSSWSARPLPPAADATPRAVFGPSWFAAVMGTGIVANAAVTLPRSCPGLRTFAVVVWVGAALLLILLAVAYLRQRALRVHAADPVAAQFFGAPPVALLTVGAGTLLLGRRLIGFEAALGVDWVLWSLGTVLGLVTACMVPYLMVTRHRFAPDAAFGGWLLPVVPPMVSAATGALLVPHAPAGQWRLALLLGCYAMLGLGFIAALLVLAMIYGRLVHHDVPSATVVPTVWIGLGALGQAVTALGALAGVAPGVLAGTYARGAAVAALLGGVAVWGFAMLWLMLAAGLTVRTVRSGLSFAPTWWSFIFPVGACVTATSALAARTGSQLFVWVAVVLYALVVIAWVVVVSRSLHHAAGHLRGWPVAKHARRRPVELEAQLGAAPVLRGTVRGSSGGGRPVSEARVTVLDLAGDVVGVAVTAEDGSYVFTGLEADRYTVVAAGYPARAASLTLDAAGEDAFDLTLVHEEG